MDSSDSQAGGGGSPSAGVPRRSRIGCGRSVNSTPRAHANPANERKVRLVPPDRIWLTRPSETPRRAASCRWLRPDSSVLRRLWRQLRLPVSGCPCGERAPLAHPADRHRPTRPADRGTRYAVRSAHRVGRPCPSNSAPASTPTSTSEWRSRMPTDGRVRRWPAARRGNGPGADASRGGSCQGCRRWWPAAGSAPADRSADNAIPPTLSALPAERCRG